MRTGKTCRNNRRFYRECAAVFALSKKKVGHGGVRQGSGNGYTDCPILEIAVNW